MRNIAAVTLLIAIIAAIAAPAHAQTDITHLEAIPEQGEGIFQMLRRFGLKANELGYQSFCGLNAPLLGEGDALFPDRTYRLPVVVASFGEPYGAVLAKFGVSDWSDEIFVYNQLFNDRFDIDSIDSIPSDQVLYIPENRSGFYERGSGILPVSYVREAPISEEFEAAGLGAPYPQIKDNIERGVLGDELSGYCFIIDPGHGGNDPGTNPYVERGDGVEAHAFEASLVYDVSLRLLKHIRLHGGEVYLTHYSPDFGIRNENNPQDYRKQKYNLSSSDITRDTPAQSIRTRLDIVRSIIARNYNHGAKTVFLSIHADFLPDKTMDLPVMVYYHRMPELDGGRSRQFALKLAEAVTGSAENVKSQGLGVLYRNPADLELLVELANLNNRNGAWRLRDPSYREKLARMLCGGLLAALD